MSASLPSKGSHLVPRSPQVRPNERAERSKLMERLLGPRIAQKIFLGYVLPLAFLLAFGIILPIFLWFYLGRTIHALEDYNWLADHAKPLIHDAKEVETHAENVLRDNDSLVERPEQVQQNFSDARNAYVAEYREIQVYATNMDDQDVQIAVDRIRDQFETWMRLAVAIPIRTARAQPHRRPPPAVLRSQLIEIQNQFGPVMSHIQAFSELVERERIDQERRARDADVMRECTSIFIPLVAIILSLLVGRSIALSITRPLDLLTYATREIGQASGPLRVLLEDFGEAGGGADDEFGDLQRSFRQMARTIAQREAVLHAQNEAVGALNRRIEAVLNATNDGILMLDRAGGFSVVNRRLADLFSMELDSLLDHTFSQAGPLLLSRFKDRTAIRRRFQELIDDPDGIADEVYDLVEPPGRTVRIYSAPVRGRQNIYRVEDPTVDGAGSRDHPELLGRIFVFRDVTRETMLDRMKTEFVSTVSHELRTPLTAIKGYVDLMVSGQTGPLNPVQTEFMSMVQDSTRRLTDLIVDMLDITRIESGRIELRHESVAYLPLVRQTVRMMQQEADARGVELRVVGPDGAGAGGENEAKIPAVHGDADRITQVLTNFISNGIKYTPAGGQVTVRVEYEKDFITTCVEDTGIGISEEDQRRLFQKFFRADNSTTREAGGTGLGLAITKTILEKLNGSVWVKSAAGQGSRFFFTLPCVDSRRTRAEDGQGESHEMSGDSGIRINQESLQPIGAGTLVLPVTSDLPALHRLGHELRRHGFATSGASARAEAVRRARDLRPDWVILDPLSAGLDAAVILREFKSLERESVTSILLGSLQLHSDGSAAFRDDLMVLPARDGVGQPMAEAFAAVRNSVDGRRSAGGGDTDSLNVLALGDASLYGQLEPALRTATGRRGRLSIVESSNQFDTVVQNAAATHGQMVPDVIVIGTGVGAEGEHAIDLGMWLGRLRRRRHESWIACVLLIDDATYDALDIQTVTPFGTGNLPVERVVFALPRRMHGGKPTKAPLTEEVPLNEAAGSHEELRIPENAEV